MSVIWELVARELDQGGFCLCTHALRRESFATVVWRVEGTIFASCCPARVRTSRLCRAEMDGFGLEAREEARRRATASDSLRWLPI